MSQKCCEPTFNFKSWEETNLIESSCTAQFSRSWFSQLDQSVRRVWAKCWLAGHIDWNAVLSIQAIVLLEVIYTGRFHHILSRFSQTFSQFKGSLQKSYFVSIYQSFDSIYRWKMYFKSSKNMFIVIHCTLALTCLIIYSSGQKMPKTESVLCQKTCGTPKLFLQQLVPVHWRE